MAGRTRRRSFFSCNSYFIFGFIVVTFLLITLASMYFWSSEDDNSYEHKVLRHLETNEVVQIDKTQVNETERNSSCTFHSCVSVYHCGYNDETKISVYIYPLKEYVDKEGNSLVASMSREFAQILLAIAESPYYTSDPSTACMFVPSIDLLNQNNIFTSDVGKVLASLPW